MKLTVCEFPDEASRHEAAWRELVSYLGQRPTDVLVLPEMPFVEWQMFMSTRVDQAQWAAALSAHDRMIERFPELSAAFVLSSRPIEENGIRLNEAFSWCSDGGYRGVRRKYYLPDEPDGRESTWFAAGDAEFKPASLGPLTCGFQICSELMFPEHARALGQGGAQLIAAPRATGGHLRWRTASSMAAIVSGCFVASANRRSFTSDQFAGRSSVMSPNGELLCETSVDEPYITIDVDLAEADRAKSTYPRSVVIPVNAQADRRW